MDKKRILVIEDQQDVRENIAELLGLSNYEVATAANGKLGVKAALDSPPDLVLCDIMMPEMDGYEVLYLLMKNPETAAIPFIFLTAKAEKTDVRKGMNLGADDYITKPFEEMELLNVVEKRLEKYAALKASAGNPEDFLRQAAKYANIQSLLSDQKRRKYKKKDIIYREGDYASYAYMIRSGKVKTYKINTDGKEFIHDILSDGCFLGEKALIQDTDRTEFAMALEDTELVLIPRQDFLDLVFGNRDVSGQFMKLLAENIIGREKELMNMAYNTVRKRTADALIRLYHKYHKPDGITSYSVSRADLASMVGTAQESVIRILSEFKSEGLIEIQGSNIAVLKPEVIEKIKY
jgi:CRP-like cAMP-binding protein